MNPPPLRNVNAPLLNPHHGRRFRFDLDQDVWVAIGYEPGAPCLFEQDGQEPIAFTIDKITRPHLGVVRIWAHVVIEPPEGT